MFRKFLSEKLPFLGKYKRFIKAVYDRSLPVKDTYSQYGEDVYMAELIQKSGIQGIYIDVGANHPTLISNTYLLYKNGFSGICVDPNEELISLFRLVRPRDISLACGASNSNQLLKFYISKTPVLSSFNQNLEHQGQVWKEKYVPVLTVDQLAAAKPDVPVVLLSVDVEGFDLQVLEGAIRTLPRTFLICVEFNSDEEKDQLSRFLETNDFQLLKQYHCNLIFVNQKFLKHI
jgi:FkbM family methyltransferase